MPKFVANILIVLDVESEPHAYDAISETMRAVCDGKDLLNWGYASEGGIYTGPRQIPDPWARLIDWRNDEACPDLLPVHAASGRGDFENCRVLPAEAEGAANG
jgi:hypothetical protein